MDKCSRFDGKHIDKLLVVGPLSSFGPWELEYEECFGHKPSVKRLISGISKTDKQDYLISSRTSELTLISYARLAEKEHRMNEIMESMPIPLFDNASDDLGDEDIKALIKDYVRRTKKI